MTRINDNILLTLMIVHCQSHTHRQTDGQKDADGHSCVWSTTMKWLCNVNQRQSM